MLQGIIHFTAAGNICRTDCEVQFVPRGCYKDNGVRAYSFSFKKNIKINDWKKFSYSVGIYEMPEPDLKMWTKCYMTCTNLVKVKRAKLSTWASGRKIVDLK